MGVRRPSWINKQEICRPKGLSQIKPKRTPGDQHPIEKRESKSFTLRATELFLHPGCGNSRERADKRERHERTQISLPFEPTLFPPKDNRQNNRRHSDGSFCE